MFFFFCGCFVVLSHFFFGDLFFGGENLRRVNFVQSKLVALRLDKYKSYRIGTKRGSYSKKTKKTTEQLGGGFKYIIFYFQPLFGEDFQFD